MKTLILLCALPLAAFATDPTSLLKNYEKLARESLPSFQGFSAERGKTLYFFKGTKNGESISCSSCHSASPRGTGKTRAGKEIAPLSPELSPERFSGEAKTEKWFKRNCADVLGRECTPLEKGDFLTFVCAAKAESK